MIFPEPLRISTLPGIALAASMVIITGVLLIVSGLCKLGFITAFLSKPVMDGFVASRHVVLLKIGSSRMMYGCPTSRRGASSPPSP